MSEKNSTPLTAELVRELFDYDPETGALTWKSYASIKRCSLHPNNKGYLRVGIDGKSYLQHRLCWLHFYGSLKVVQINHINRIKTDNRIVNLRNVSQSENLQNRMLTKKNKTGFKGVTLSQNRKKFIAQIQIGGKKINLGRFATPERAYMAYQTAAQEYHIYNPSALPS